VTLLSFRAAISFVLGNFGLPPRYRRRDNLLLGLNRSL
jgi:hypothetical protein